MASRNYGYHVDRSNGYQNNRNNSNKSDHRSSGPTVASAISYREPHVFLDLRDYYSSSRQNDAPQSSGDRYSRHKEESYAQNSDYISPPSAPHSDWARSDYISRPLRGDRFDTSYSKSNLNADNTSKSHEGRSYTRSGDCAFPPAGPYSSRTRSDYISPPPKTDRCQTPYSTQAYNTYGTTRSHQTQHVPRGGKSDYQIIKEGGWKNKKQFMESHGINFHELGAFGEAKDILDGHRRVDDQAMDDYISEQGQVSNGTNGHGRYRDGDAVFDKEDCSGSSGDSGNYGNAVNERDCSPEPRGGLERAHSPHYSSPFTAYDDDRDYSEKSAGHENASYYENSDRDNGNAGEGVQELDEDSDSSDCDSTDAIDYYSDSNPEDDEMGGDDFVDDQSTDEYDNDDYY